MLNHELPNSPATVVIARTHCTLSKSAGLDVAQETDRGKYSLGPKIGHCAQALNIQNFDLLVVHTQQLHFLHAAE